ncbi:nitroreductase/quinone reductase family protein [Nocardia sp. CA2R105]|uniref:nitroreductase/quinone reductase family protein n=1 Tax=Nocardia coffeae TaxID=2873381 RepID=UPI001CA67316|nr:nitroreductase/quinone reductase family protein [Nocardia coffeae]MBY8860095.1 nitroreductase/quinone reductase family protein [Nocardia coffeae]
MSYAGRRSRGVHNIKAHPDHVFIELAERGKVKVTVTELTGTERDDAWKRIVAAVARFGNYEQKTDRVIPVLRLTAQP